jgi:hypothetical protein
LSFIAPAKKRAALPLIPQILPIGTHKICSDVRVKPVTDKQVFYDKFLCDKFYLPSACVYMQRIFYDKFLYDKFYLLV